jgi:hypothetical protein
LKRGRRCGEVGRRCIARDVNVAAIIEGDVCAMVVAAAAEIDRATEATTFQRLWMSAGRGNLPGVVGKSRDPVRPAT